MGPSFRTSGFIGPKKVLEMKNKGYPNMNQCKPFIFQKSFSS